MIITFLSVYMLILLGMQRNFKQESWNKHHIYDEVLILLVVYHLFCSTDFVLDIETRV